MPELTIPAQAMQLLRDDYVRCLDLDFAAFVERHSRGGLIVVQPLRKSGAPESTWLLIPAARWATIAADVAGIIAELAAARERGADGGIL